jgi:hypothetical protein
MSDRPDTAPSLTDLIEERRALAIRLAELEAMISSSAVAPVESGKLLTPEEAAQLAGVSPAWLIRTGRRLRCSWFRRMGRRTVRVDSASFARWLASRRPS